MPPVVAGQGQMQVLSPRSANVPAKQRTNMQKSVMAPPSKPAEKPNNPDRIDDRWRPPVSVTEPGDAAQTYNVGKKLGKGGFAVCFEGVTQSTNELFALKVVKAQVEQKKMMEKFRTEMQIHAKMQHPNIVEFYRAFTHGDHTYVVLEMCNNGSLADMVKMRSCLSLPEVRRYMIQICGGVKYMHKRNVIHRDLKMGNIFLDQNMNVKIGDFGLAAVLADDQDRRTTLCGTPNYIAPEILIKSGARGHDSKVDVWAIGIICYAMLMGTPPFASKTQQEIYSRLKSLDYEWKVDSKNHIPQDCKDFVAACLNLVATERPEMDDLVEFSFFNTGAIADVLDRSCMKAKPVWLLEADPRGDKVRPGYGVGHKQLCEVSGVGRLACGQARPAAGEKGNISALIEIEAENRRGCAPITPLPAGVLYRQFTDPEPQKAAFQRSITAKPRSRKPPIEAREVLEAAVEAPAPIISARVTSQARPTQSFAAQQRLQAAPRAALPRVPQSSTEPIPQPENKCLLKARPVRIAPSKHSLQAEILSTKTAKSTRPEVEMTLEGRPRSQPEVRTNGLTRTRGLPRPQTTCVNQDRPQSSSSDTSNDGRPNPLMPMTRNTLTQKTATILLAQVEADFANALSMTDELPLPCRRVYKPRIVEDRDKYTRVHGTSHTHVLQSLRTLHKSLSQPSLTTPRPLRPMEVYRPYARVEKWVDYATKHGIAYLLTDGSLGIVLKSKEEENKSSGCVVIRNAKRHTELRTRGKEHQFVPQSPGSAAVEFYEQVDPVEPMRRLDVSPADLALDLENGSSSNAAAAKAAVLRGAELSRWKEVTLLDKFGKYMHKQMDSISSSSTMNPCDSVGHLIHFYQRLGNVGVWRFADGGIQFNFPDHTKLVIYEGHSSLDAAETMVDVIYLEPRDARDMKEYGLVTHEALERRDLKTFRLADIKRSSDLRRSETEIIRANEVCEKLEWIEAVIGCWLAAGGLGWTGEEKLGWSGLQEKREDKKPKFQWVTVGRPGGDAEKDVLIMQR